MATEGEGMITRRKFMKGIGALILAPGLFPQKQAALTFPDHAIIPSGKSYWEFKDFAESEVHRAFFLPPHLIRTLEENNYAGYVESEDGEQFFYGIRIIPTME